MPKSKYSDLEKTKKLVERKPDASLICARCHQLRSQNRLLDYTPYAGEAPRSGQVIKLSESVASFNRPAIIKEIFKQIYHGSIIVYVLDITNFEGSQIEEIYSLINSKKCRVIFIVNKIDALPESFNVRPLQAWVKDQIKDKLDDGITFHICLTSAKKATGAAKVLEILEKWKKSMAGRSHLPKIYVLGSVNAGKSSFINSLLFKSNKYRDMSKIHHREKYNVLTESPAPGTTLGLVTVEQFKLGFRVIDTPGIPNLNQVSSHIKDYEDLLTVVPTKVMQSFSMNVKQGYSVWLGALARLDVLSGSDKYYTFFMPQNVTIHRTPYERAEEVYLNRAGTLLRPTYDTEPQNI
jgi:ribosome biogenesis GTPase A